ncbi:MAG: AMP-binding protein, partial [Acidimicrobiia bacterium]|nr:AMP-binding protein [Acidimicrobiia bacterium]
MNIGQIPAKWARQTPQGTAIIDATTGQRVNWADFDNHVRRLANGLRGLGLEQGDRVGVLSRNSAEYAALYFACGRTGLVAQPMNWRLSPPELKKITDNGEPRAYISGPDYHAVAAELAGMTDSVEHWLQYGPDG